MGQENFLFQKVLDQRISQQKAQQLLDQIKNGVVTLEEVNPQAARYQKLITLSPINPDETSGSV